MKKIIYSMILIIWAVAVHGQQMSIRPSPIPPIPNTKLILHLYAKGVQIYQCTQDPKDTAHYVWTFKEPKATLFTAADYKQAAGKHYLNATKNPTWELSDGSFISGVKLHQSPAPDSNAIPWLLLSGVTESGKGSLADVKFIQRLYTHGGSAPKIADPSQKGQLLQVPYTAEYLFYK
jgi:hypothetical protein